VGWWDEAARQASAAAAYYVALDGHVSAVPRERDTGSGDARDTARESPG
jgi:hypothetical protein